MPTERSLIAKSIVNWKKTNVNVVDDRLVVEPGIYAGMAGSLFATAQGLSFTATSKLIQSLAHYIDYRERGTVTTPAMEFGRLYHMAVLEPERVEENYAEVEKQRRGTSQWKALEAEHEGKTLLFPEDFAKIRAMRYRLFLHPAARELLKSAITTEASVFWYDEATGLWIKGRPDLLCEGDVMADLKTVTDSSKEGMRSSARKFGIHVQAALYGRAIAGVTGRFPRECKVLAQESTPPYCPAVYTIHAEALVFGSYLIDKAMNLLRKYKNDEDVPRFYSDDEEVLNLASWVYREHEDFSFWGER